MTEWRRAAALVPAFVGPSLVGATMVVWATRQGIGVTIDSVVYLDAARHLSRGQGFTSSTSEGLRPLTHFPPRYPSVLAALASSGVNLQRAAVMLGTGLLITLVVSIGYLVWRMTGSVAVSAGAQLLIAAAPSVVEAHSMAWSEGLFLLLTVWALAFLAEYLERRRLHHLFYASALAGLAMLTRYAGLALAGTLVVALLVSRRARPLSRVAEIGAASLMMGVPFACWTIRNLSIAGNATDRILALHLISALHFRIALSTAIEWLSPSVAPPARTVVLGLPFVAVGAALLAWLAWRNDRIAPSRSLSTLRPVTALFAVAYVSFLFISITFVDASTPPDRRILSLVFVTLVLFTSSSASALASVRSSTGLSGAAAATVALWSMVLVQDLRAPASWASEAHEQGLGLNSPARRTGVSQLASAATANSAVVLSNCPDVLYFEAETRALPLPTKRSATSHVWNPSFASELGLLQETMRRGGSVVFVSQCDAPYAPSQADLERLGALVAFRNSYGVVYHMRALP